MRDTRAAAIGCFAHVAHGAETALESATAFAPEVRWIRQAAALPGWGA